MQEPPSDTLDLELSDGSIVRWAYSPAPADGYEEVSVGGRVKAHFRQVTQTVAAMAEDLQALYRAAQPNKMSIEFGVEISAEAGELTALIVKGSGKGNLKITLEWEKPKVTAEAPHAPGSETPTEHA